MRTHALLPLLLFAMSLSAQESESFDYGNNIISVSPFSVYGSDYISDVFVGITYEHLFNDFMSLGTQVAVGLEDEGYQIGFGPKFYPSGHGKVVSYGLAPTFLYTSSLSNNYYFYSYDPISGEYFNYVEENRVSQFGFMLVNSLNVTLNSKVHFSLDGGIGVNYINDFENDRNFNTGPDVTGMLRCNMGYRF